MKKTKTMKSYIGLISLCGLLGMALPVSVWADDDVPDNVVQTVAYFPMPYITYQNLFIGKKLDIGLTQPFVVTLGNSDCTTHLRSIEGQMSPFYLPASSNPTPVYLRSSLPESPLTDKKGTLDISDLGSELRVKEVEVGKRDYDVDGKLKAVHSQMGDVTLNFANLTLGQQNVSRTLNQLQVTGTTSVPIRIANSNSFKQFSIPPCTDEDGNRASAHWKENVNVGGSTYTALVCGKEQKAPFESSCFCEPEGFHKIHTWCAVEGDGYYLSDETCDPDKTYYRLFQTQSNRVVGTTDTIDYYCGYLDSQPNALTAARQAALDAFNSAHSDKPLCEIEPDVWTDETLENCVTRRLDDNFDPTPYCSAQMPVQIPVLENTYAPTPFNPRDEFNCCDVN